MCLGVVQSMLWGPQLRHCLRWYIQYIQYLDLDSTCQEEQCYSFQLLVYDLTLECILLIDTYWQCSSPHDQQAHLFTPPFLFHGVIGPSDNPYNSTVCPTVLIRSCLSFSIYKNPSGPLYKKNLESTPLSKDEFRFPEGF